MGSSFGATVFSTLRAARSLRTLGDAFVVISLAGFAAGDLAAVLVFASADGLALMMRAALVAFVGLAGAGRVALGPFGVTAAIFASAGRSIVVLVFTGRVGLRDFGGVFTLALWTLFASAAPAGFEGGADRLGSRVLCTGATLVGAAAACTPTLEDARSGKA